MATILVDVDDVVADLCPTWIKQFRSSHSQFPDILSLDWEQWDVAHLVPEELQSDLWSLLDHDLYRYVFPVDGALQGVELLRQEGHRIVFVTAATVEHAGAKYYWLVRHGFLERERYPSNYVEACDKSLLRGDIILDDKPTTCHNFQKAGGRAILFKRQFQKTHLPFDLRKGLRTADGWWEVPAQVDYALRGFSIDTIQTAKL